MPALGDELFRLGLDIRTEAERISESMAIMAALGWVFAAVFLLGTTGFVLTIGLHLTATEVEKSRELLLLRLLGLRSAELSLLPSMQGLLIGLVGSLIAVSITFAAQPVVNSSLSGLAGLEGPVSRLEKIHGVAAILGAIGAGAISGCVAGYRATRLEPTAGLRHE